MTNKARFSFYAAATFFAAYATDLADAPSRLRFESSPVFGAPEKSEFICAFPQTSPNNPIASLDIARADNNAPGYPLEEGDMIVKWKGSEREIVLRGNVIQSNTSADLSFIFAEAPTWENLKGQRERLLGLCKNKPVLLAGRPRFP